MIGRDDGFSPSEDSGRVGIAVVSVFTLYESGCMCYPSLVGACATLSIDPSEGRRGREKERQGGEGGSLTRGGSVLISPLPFLVLRPSPSVLLAMSCLIDLSKVTNTHAIVSCCVDFSTGARFSWRDVFPSPAKNIVCVLSSGKQSKETRGSDGLQDHPN